MVELVSETKKQDIITKNTKAQGLADDCKNEKNEVKSLQERFEKAGQGHLFKFFDQIGAEEAKEFIFQLENTDIEAILEAFHKAENLAKNSTARLQPSPLKSDDLILSNDKNIKLKFWEKGMSAIASGKVAIVTLAGGQGTRLGSSLPKGCYDIGLFSKNSLFELQAKRLLKLSKLAGIPSIEWFLMTSTATHAETVKFFEKHKFFGLCKDSVTFFKQGELPAIDDDGKLILKTKGSLALSPNGNGGIYPSLLREGIIDKMIEKGIEFVHMFCVDNALVRVADPYFIGGCIENKTDCAAKSILKTDPSESVGLFCRRKDGKLIVAEYSELDTTLVSQADRDGNLIFNQANIANHFFTVDFLKKVSNKKLPLHLARKKIPSIDLASGAELQAPQMGYKLESFIFDVFEFAEKPKVYQSIREEEFAPLKNAPGTPTDSPDFCRKLLLDVHRKWLTAAGAKLAAEQEVEISPLVSYAGEGLERFKDQEIKENYIEK